MTDLPALIHKIHDWHKENRKEHFFRQNRTPYRVWISEVALQQTRIAAAAERLAHFLKTFPTLQTLAKAPEEEVVRAFSGLGYYNRARNLSRGARHFQEHYGKLPDSYKQLLQAPSIGPYTAAAIASICFGQRHGVIDGNVRRIIARLLGLKAPPGDKNFESACETFMEGYICTTNLDPGFLNEAIMELGQEICTVKTPRCPGCPIKSLCKGSQNPLQYPAPKKKPAPIEVDWYAAICTDLSGSILIQRYRDFRFLKEMWGFPSALSIHTGETILNEYSDPAMAGARINWNTFDLGPRHTITNHKIRFHTAILGENALIPSDEMEWVTRQEAIQRLASSAMRKLFGLLEKT